MFTKILATSCLILVHFLETFDSFGVDGVIPLIQQHYSINDSETAIIKTSTSILNTCTLALIWIFGDAFKRRKLFLVSVTAWIACSLVSTLLGSTSFLVFVAFRSFGAAASSIIGVLSPVLLGDLFEDRALTIALMCLSVGEIAAPLLAGIVNSWLVSGALPCQSGLVSVTVLAVPLLLVLLCTKIRVRDDATAKEKLGLKAIVAHATGIASIKSYLLITAGFALAQFQKRAYNFWFPSMYILVWQNVPGFFLGLSYTTVFTLNTLAILVSTAVGLPITLWIAQNWLHGTGVFGGRGESPRAFPIIQSTGCGLSAAAFLISIVVLDKSYLACVGATVLVGLGGAPDACLRQQMMIMVVPATSRAAAFALTQLVVEIFTIPSAQLVGTITDLVRGDSTAAFDRFHAYQIVLLCTSLILALSVLCYAALIYFFPADWKRAEAANNDSEADDESTALIDKKEDRSESIVPVWSRMSSVSHSDCH